MNSPRIFLCDCCHAQCLSKPASIGARGHPFSANITIAHQTSYGQQATSFMQSTAIQDCQARHHSWRQPLPQAHSQNQLELYDVHHLNSPSVHAHRVSAYSGPTISSVCLDSFQTRKARACHGTPCESLTDAIEFRHLWHLRIALADQHEVSQDAAQGQLIISSSFPQSPFASCFHGRAFQKMPGLAANSP